MSIPTFLKKGDKVAVICPAGHIKEDLTLSYDIIRSWGLEPIVYPSVTAQHYTFAGNDHIRRQDLQCALDDRDIRAIICGRGGYGCVRIIDDIDFSGFAKDPKWLVGFSDVTALHSHINRTCGVPSIHGPMVKALLDATAASIDSLRSVLFGELTDLEYPAGAFPNRTGQSEGILIGGNLAILHSMIGSDSDMDYKDKILFLEDVCETHYNIDRMLWTLKRAKKFEKLQGLIVGTFTELRDTPSRFGQSVQEIIMDKIKDLSFPVAFGCPAGHIDDNRALILGQKIKLSVHPHSTSIKYIQ